jgi:hypothetical protein
MPAPTGKNTTTTVTAVKLFEIPLFGGKVHGFLCHDRSRACVDILVKMYYHPEMYYCCLRVNASINVPRTIKELVLAISLPLNKILQDVLTRRETLVPDLMIG